jgi:hypothetical protein
MDAFIKTILLLLIFVSCNSQSSDQSGLMTINIRKEINNPRMLMLHHEIENATFVSLEETEDNTSLIDGVYDYAVTEKYIISVFTMEGEFVEYISHDYQAIFEHNIGNNQYAAVAFAYLPFQSGSFGIGIFTDRGDTVAMKNDFYSDLIPNEKAGFTVGLTTPAYSAQSQSVLFKTGSNDTLFRISAEKIRPVCILDLQNSDNEIIRSLDATDFSSLRKQQPEGKDIYVADMFETPKGYYFRLLYNNDYYVASTDKRTGETFVEKCIQPGNLHELADVNLQRGMIGSRSYRNFPVWGRMEGENLVQIITPYELNFFKDNDSITIPENLNVNEEGNPIFIFYQIRK